MKSFAAVLISCSTAYCLAAYGQDVTSPTHGTINVLLANKNGAVLITDSKISDSNYKQISDHARKLFKLDDKTVCSIANFYSDSGPVLQQTRPNGFAALFQSVDALVTSFSQGLQNQPQNIRNNLTVEQKADALAQYEGIALVMLETEKRASSKYSGLTAFQQLIVLGYEADGTLTATKRVISVEPDDPNEPALGPVHSHIQPEKTCHIMDDFCSITAGIEFFAQKRLNMPENFAKEKEMSAYLLAHRQHTESKLTVKDLEAFAYHLKEVSEGAVAALGKPVIGGDIQEATLVGGKVRLSSPKEPFIRLPKYQSPTFLIGLTTSNVAILNGFGADKTTVLINTVCSEGSGIMLDGTVILGGKYDRCNLFFDGRAFYLDPRNVSMKLATLVVGPHSNDQVVDSAVASLPPDIKIACWRDVPIPLDLQRATIWRVGYSPDEEIESIPSPNNVWTPQVQRPAQVEAIRNALIHCGN